MILDPKSQFLITTALEGTSETVRLYVDFYEPLNPEKIQPQYKLAEIYLLTEKASYFCNLRRSDIVLSWNLTLYYRLRNVFSEKSGNLIVGFDSEKRLLTVSTENQFRAIRFLLFQKENITLLDTSPSSRMIKLLAKFHYEKEQILDQLVRKEQRETEKINKIDTLTRQVKDATADDTQQMKDRFMPLINKIKEQIRLKRNLDDEQSVSVQEGRENDAISEGEQKNKKMFKILGRKKQGNEESPQQLNQLQEMDENMSIQGDFQEIF